MNLNIKKSTHVSARRSSEDLTSHEEEILFATADKIKV